MSILHHTALCCHLQWEVGTHSRHLGFPNRLISHVLLDKFISRSRQLQWSWMVFGYYLRIKCLKKPTLTRVCWVSGPLLLCTTVETQARIPDGSAPASHLRPIAAMVLLHADREHNTERYTTVLQTHNRYTIKLKTNITCLTLLYSVYSGVIFWWTKV